VVAGRIGLDANGQSNVLYSFPPDLKAIPITPGVVGLEFAGMDPASKYVVNGSPLSGPGPKDLPNVFEVVSVTQADLDGGGFTPQQIDALRKLVVVRARGANGQGFPRGFDFQILDVGRFG
jgi:hypothetical protein